MINKYTLDLLAMGMLIPTIVPLKTKYHHNPHYTTYMREMKRCNNSSKLHPVEKLKLRLFGLRLFDCLLL